MGMAVEKKLMSTRGMSVDEIHEKIRSIMAKGRYAELDGNSIKIYKLVKK